MKPLPTLLLILAALASAQTPKRIEPIAVRAKRALVIGNAAYARSPLASPVKDAEAMSAVLRDLGFTVTQAVNLDKRALTQQIDRFSAQVQAGDLALFYFSGHGVRVGAESYLAPVDYAGTSEADVQFDAYPVDKVRAKLEERSARLRILLLDACRDNPYSTRKGVGQGGLAAPVLQAEGTFVGFATGANNTADDSPVLGNSLYTKYLMDAMRTPGLTLQEVFSRVKETVYSASRGKQNPAYYDEVVGRFWFVPPSAAPVNPDPGTNRRDEGNAAGRNGAGSPGSPAGVVSERATGGASPVPSKDDKPLRVGGTVQSAMLISQVKPVYPPLARAARVQGTVNFEVVIGEDGSVQDLHLIGGPPFLVEAAGQAVAQWKYRPTLVGGKPVKVLTTVDVNFTLSQ